MLSDNGDDIFVFWGETRRRKHLADEDAFIAVRQEADDVIAVRQEADDVIAEANDTRVLVLERVRIMIPMYA